MTRPFVLTLSAPLRRGIMAAVTGFLSMHDCSIVEAQQFADRENDRFFMRAHFEADDGAVCPEGLAAAFVPIAERMAMDARFTDGRAKTRALLMVSRFGHCLHDLLHRWKAGQLPIDVAGVVSNHDDMRSFVEWAGVPFHHLPVVRGCKAEQEARILGLVDDLSIDLVVLARYMQILSPELAERLAGRCINIHHSFLPAFKGAKPYHQAHARGVKFIGATAHFVTSDLDEGPIIEQETRRVSHARTAAELVMTGQELEAMVLTRAVRWYAERRILLNRAQTIVFD